MTFVDFVACAHVTKSEISLFFYSDKFLSHARKRLCRQNSTPDELARDLYEERAAIREFDGGQDRAEAERDAWQEASSAAGITALDDWRREADDPHNPDAWK